MDNSLANASENGSSNSFTTVDSSDSTNYKEPALENAQSLSVQAWSQAELTLLAQNDSGKANIGDDSENLTLTPIEWGSETMSNGDSDPKQENKDNPENEDEKVRNSILEGFKRIKSKENKSSGDEDSNQKPEVKDEKDIKPAAEKATKEAAEPQEKPQEKQPKDLDRQKIKDSLRDLYSDTKDSPQEEERRVIEELGKHDITTLEKIAQEEIDELTDSLPEKEYEKPEGPSLFDKTKYPVLTALVAYGGYRVIKAGGKFVLQKVRGTNGKAESAKESKTKSGEKAPTRSEAETRDVRNEETKQNEPRSRRRTARGGERQVVNLNERIESKTNGEGLYRSEKVSGSEAILGKDKASESLTRNEVDMLKREISRLKASKDPAEIKKGNNLERVARILENSNSPKVQEKAHKIIRERIEAESARKGLKGKVGKAVGIGIIASAALYYFINQLDHSQDAEENDRATVSDK